jgi:chemotaxis protein CheD
VETLEAASHVVYIAPGQLAVARDRSVLKTILGSCVAVCLYDPALRVGGMNHFLLPAACTAHDGSFRHGERAMSELLRRVSELGSCARELCAGVYGGARVLGELSAITHLGERNVEFALAWLEARQIPVVAHEVLGARARRVEFSVETGQSRIQVLGEA